MQALYHDDIDNIDNIFKLTNNMIGKGNSTRLDASSTSNATKHLKRRHKISQEGKEISIGQNQMTLERAFDQTRAIFNVKNFEMLIIQWFMFTNQAFLHTSNKYFRRIIKYLMPGAVKSLPTSPTTIRNWILSSFHESKSAVCKALLDSMSAIHFSFDLWTSPNSYAILGVMGHWVDAAGVLQTALLGMPRLDGPHTGENICESFWQVLTEYNLFYRIGYFMLDNASSNDMALMILYQKLQTYDSTIPFLDKHRRLRCFGHIINLVVKTLLFGKDAQAFEIEDEQMERLDMEERRFNEWRKKGLLPKIYNIIFNE
jgi:hypothetical protein